MKVTISPKLADWLGPASAWGGWFCGERVPGEEVGYDVGGTVGTIVGGRYVGGITVGMTVIGGMVVGMMVMGSRVGPIVAGVRKVTQLPVDVPALFVA